MPKLKPVQPHFFSFLTPQRINKFIDWSVIIFILFYTLAAALVAVNRFWQFEVFYYDFGIFDQALWKVAHFQPPIVEHLVVANKWIFADHFTPGLFLLTPLYWLTDRPEIMLIAQAIAVGVSALVIHRIAKKVIGEAILAAAVVMSYCLFVGLQNALIADMHEVVFMLVPLSLTLEAIVFGRKKALWFWFGLTLLFKESTFLLGIGLGLFLWWIRRDWWKQALTMMVISAAWGALVTQIIIPHFSGGQYAYKPDFYREPWKNVLALVDDPLKRQTQLISLWSFGFLPILAPASWPLIGQDFIIRFVPQNTMGRWTLGMHYSAQLAPVLAVGMMYGLVFLVQRLKVSNLAKVTMFSKMPLTWGNFMIWMVALGLIGNALYLHQIKLHGPLGLAYNKAFYTHSADFDFLHQLMDLVPSDASVMTQNNLAAHFTHQQVWLLRDNYDEFKPDYVVLDLRPEQNPNNLFGMAGDLPELVKRLQVDSHYTLIYNTEDQWAFKRKFD